MKILTKDEITEEIKNKIRDGAVFIYPTDTIYGIGCNALDDKAVKRIRKIKVREEKPFSVIAPSKEWIKENCYVGDELDKLPGPYTLILKLKNKDRVSENVNNNLGTLGVRIPDHWFSKIVEGVGIPIVTTSVNKSKEKFMTCLKDLDSGINVDFVIYEGKKEGKPSKLIINGKVVER